MAANPMLTHPDGPSLPPDAPSAKPSVFQFELRNHQLRKQIESCHKKIIYSFSRKKRELVRLVELEDRRKLRAKQMDNKMENCYEKISRGKSEAPHLNTRIPNSHRRNSEELMGRKGSLPHPGQPKTEETPFCQLWDGQGWRNRSGNREVLLSNIANLEELRMSLSHSRASFNRKAIKMSRPIGSPYLPYEDQLPGGEDCVKGIFF